jgi:hypothetical protein
MSAADWIKLVIHPEHPKVARIARLTGDDPDVVFAKAVRWFRWVDQHCADAETEMTASGFHGVLRCPDDAAGDGLLTYAEAFSDAKVDWITIGPDGVVLVQRFDSHFGTRRINLASASRRPRSGGGWPSIRLVVLERDGWTCAYCGDAANSVDHMLPQSRGGTEEVQNLVAACVRCNSAKRDRTPSEAGMTPVFCAAEVLVP